jgi:CDP-glucose 4,6-dehydratase
VSGPANSSLVTGGLGFVGAWLCRELLGRGHRVVSLDRAAREGRLSALAMLGIQDQVDQVEGELLDPELLRRLLDEHQVSAVFHLAAQTIVGTAAASPGPTFETNVRGTWTLLEACREHGVERVVVASSDKAYGAHEELP